MRKSLICIIFERVKNQHNIIQIERFFAKSIIRAVQRRTVTFFFGEAKIRQNYFVMLFFLTEMQTTQLIVRCPVNGKKDWGAFAYFAYMYGTPLEQSVQD